MSFSAPPFGVKIDQRYLNSSTFTIGLSPTMIQKDVDGHHFSLETANGKPNAL